MGKPEIKCSGEFTFEVDEREKDYIIIIQTFSKNSKIILEK
jgi:hypothetical protein